MCWEGRRRTCSGSTWTWALPHWKGDGPGRSGLQDYLTQMYGPDYVSPPTQIPPGASSMKIVHRPWTIAICSGSRTGKGTK